MDTWTKQMGYPLVTVTPTKEDNTYILTQKRFLIDPKAKSNNDSPFKYVPFCILDFFLIVLIFTLLLICNSVMLYRRLSRITACLKNSSQGLKQTEKNVVPKLTNRIPV